jgi:hypothetical protein
MIDLKNHLQQFKSQEEFDTAMVGLWMDIAVELSTREEVMLNGHHLVVEEVRGQDSRTNRWYLDGKEVAYKDLYPAINQEKQANGPTGEGG